jgi:hypothetical protein
MVFRQPFAQRGRHQKRLLTVATNEVLRHHGIVSGGPDGAEGLCDSLGCMRVSQSWSRNARVGMR